MSTESDELAETQLDFTFFANDVENPIANCFSDRLNELERSCRLEFYIASGPGGQKRNRTWRNKLILIV